MESTWRWGDAWYMLGLAIIAAAVVVYFYLRSRRKVDKH